MKRILDYEEMNNILSSLKNIKKNKPIGYTTFGYPIDHYSYGTGENHVIITAGTHASELITNVFVIRFMEKLDKGEISIDTEKYTLDFIPILNPEGTIIVTSTIRSLIPRDMSENEEQTYLLTYYRNCYIEDKYTEKYNDRNDKISSLMFRYADPLNIKGELGKNVDNIIKKYNLPKGCTINWASNGRGIDLNSNIECGEIVEKVKKGEIIYNKLHLNNIKRNVPGPVGCPFNKPGEIEPENQALLDFYEEINTKYNLIGSLIYHSCGNIVFYLGNNKEKNPWKNDFNEKEIDKNYRCAKAYAEKSNYKTFTEEKYTTMDSKLKTLYPVTLLIELGSVRATPLSQFLDIDLPGSSEDFKYVYTKIIETNTKAILRTIDEMYKINKEK